MPAANEALKDSAELRRLDEQGRQIVAKDKHQAAGKPIARHMLVQYYWQI